jgi:hypothetical protein
VGACLQRQRFGRTEANVDVGLSQFLEKRVLPLGPRLPTGADAIAFPPWNSGRETAGAERFSAEVHARRRRTR